MHTDVSATLASHKGFPHFLSRKITENSGKSRKSKFPEITEITENHGNSGNEIHENSGNHGNADFMSHNVLTSLCVCHFPFAYSTLSMSSSEPSIASVQENGERQRDLKRKWKRGSQTTVWKRANQFPGVMEVRGDAMWCIVCSCPVTWKEKSTATKHLQGYAHIHNLNNAAGRDRKSVV